jgi:hypothetical protein
LSHGDDDDWIQQVKGALDSLGLFDASMRESLIDSVREALDEVSDDGGPAITVLDGGRSKSASKSDTPQRPDAFRVVDGEADSSANVSVKVVRPRGRAYTRSRTQSSLGVGHLVLPRDSDVWQTVRHGNQAATYRVHCDVGELHLAVDGELIARLEQGQSTDLEGCVIRVRACGDAGAKGRYTKL